MSARRSALWAGMPAGPSTLPVSPRPRRSGARSRQPASPLDRSSPASARKASARPVRPWTSRAVSCASGSPHETVLRLAVASAKGASYFFDDSRFVELAPENRLCGAHARFFGEPLKGDADLLVIAGLHGHAHVERLPTPGADREGARADAPPLFPEPQLVVLVGTWPGQSPDLELCPGVGVVLPHLQLPARPWREVGRFQGSGGDLVSPQEPERVQQRPQQC